MIVVVAMAALVAVHAEEEEVASSPVVSDKNVAKRGIYGGAGYSGIGGGYDTGLGGAGYLGGAGFGGAGLGGGYAGYGGGLAGGLNNGGYSSGYYSGYYPKAVSQVSYAIGHGGNVVVHSVDRPTIHKHSRFRHRRDGEKIMPIIP